MTVLPVPVITAISDPEISPQPVLKTRHLGETDALFRKLEKNLRKLISAAQEDPAVALQLSGMLGRASYIADRTLTGWGDAYGDVVCEVTGAECGLDCGVT